MEALTGFLGSALPFVIGALGFAGVGALLNYILKKYITQSVLEGVREKLHSTADAIAKSGLVVGRVITLGASKRTKLWNSVFEPYVLIFLRLFFMDFLLRIVTKFLHFLVKGLESDNPSTKDG